MRFEHHVDVDGIITVVTRSGSTAGARLTQGWVVPQGGTAYLLVHLVDGDRSDTTWNLTGFTATLTAKKQSSDTTSLFTATSASEITLTGNGPNITVKIPPATTAALDFTGGVFDLELGFSGEVMKVLSGPVWLDREA